MKLKKITTLSLALALCLSSVITGCGKKLTPKEKLIAVTEASADIKSIEASYSMNINTPDSEFAKVTGDMAFSDFMKQGKMTQNISLNGMGIEQKIFMKDGKSYTSIPMMNKFLEADMNSSMTLDSEQMKELQKQMLEKLKTLLNEVDVTETKQDKLYKLTLTLTDEQTSKYINDIVNAIFTEDFIKSMKEQISTQTRSQIKAAGATQSEEEINAIVEQQSEMSINLIKSMLTESKFSGFSTNYYVDDKNHIKKMDTSITVDLSDSIKSIFTAVGLNIPVLTADISIDYKSLNKKVDVDFSELTEENTITMEEYASQLGSLAETPAA